MLPDDERLVEELVAPRWKHMANGVLAVESKDDIKRRLGRSTDTADAVIQSYWPSGRVFADPDRAAGNAVGTSGTFLRHGPRDHP